MKKITVIGSGCPTCQKLHDKVQKIKGKKKTKSEN